jgi:Xaa-Pro dipeptidase
MASGLCDEWPYVHYPDGWMPKGPSTRPWSRGWSSVSRRWSHPKAGSFSIKLEDQVLITDKDGCETLTRYPFDGAASG